MSYLISNFLVAISVKNNQYNKLPHIVFYGSLCFHSMVLRDGLRRSKFSLRPRVPNPPMCAVNAVLLKKSFLVRNMF